MVDFNGILLKIIASPVKNVSMKSKT
ncbi:uncharacterized protein G2W53_042982 [Senna tora]|uniref:Uncharacterized protein n=1 Tax=Senna tora TaxID=362788 RepID=A0A834W2Y8_9FABA|nr:uncharacterized protein G2W53_042982 [Senna tora]